jgi:predicted esterase
MMSHLAAALALLLAGPAELPAGQVTERVSVVADPGITYAVYLPKAYTPQKRWPILYVFDPRGRALLSLSLFKEAAEERGWIVASSYDTRSDTNDAPNERALQGMWRDTRERFPVAERRAYATGFSGGARLATVLAANSHEQVSGVILTGAGFADTDRPPAGMKFAVFGTAGTTDFNYLEMRRLPAVLGPLRTPVRVEEVAVAHAWPPAALAREGVLWLELQAQRSGLAPRDGLAAELQATWRARARERESAGDLLGALETWQDSARDLEGLADVGEEKAAAARLAARPEVAEERRRREKADREEIAYQKVVVETWSRLLQLGQPAPVVPELLRALDVSSLRSRAEKAATAYERLSAQRRLEAAFVQAYFYVPRMLLAKGEARRAAAAQEVAAEIHPAAAHVRYGLACSWARAGRKKEALAELRRAVQLGFKDAAHMGADPDLETLRGEPGFQQLLETMRTDG